MMTPREVLAMCREKGVRAVDLRLTNLSGRWAQVTLPVQRLDEELLEQGLAMDASVLGVPDASSRADILLLPQTDTAMVDPTATPTTLTLVCNVAEPITGEDFPLDPRAVAQRAANYVESSGVADQVLVGLGVDFYLFRLPPSPPRRPSIRGIEEAVAGAGEAVLGGADLATEGGAPAVAAAAADAVGVRGDVMQHLQQCGYPLDHHRGTGKSTGQSRLELMPQPLRQAGDALQMTKHVTRQAAQARGWLATFMPLPAHGLAPSQLSVQVGLLRDQRRILAGSGYGGLGEAGLHAVGGLLRHAPALMALTACSTNSFRRLVEPLQDGYSRHAGAICRVPTAQASRWAGIEFSLADGSANPYLAVAGLVMAMIDGIQNKMNPGDPVEGTESPVLVGSRGGRMPTDLESAVEALEQDHSFLLRGEVFDAQLLEAWSRLKRRDEADGLLGRPHPYEYTLYFDC